MHMHDDIPATPTANQLTLRMPTNHELAAPNLTSPQYSPISSALVVQRLNRRPIIHRLPRARPINALISSLTMRSSDNAPDNNRVTNAPGSAADIVSVPSSVTHEGKTAWKSFEVRNKFDVIVEV